MQKVLTIFSVDAIFSVCTWKISLATILCCKIFYINHTKCAHVHKWNKTEQFKQFTNVSVGRWVIQCYFNRFFFRCAINYGHLPVYWVWKNNFRLVLQPGVPSLPSFPGIPSAPARPKNKNMRWFRLNISIEILNISKQKNDSQYSEAKKSRI